MKKIIWVFLFMFMFMYANSGESATIKSRGLFDESGNTVTLKNARDLELGGDLTTDGDMTVGGEIFGGDSSYIKGLTIDYVSTTSVSIGAGKLIVDGYYTEVSQNTHTVLNFSNTNYTHLYVSSSGVITDSTTEPVLLADGTGVNGSLRFIGSLYCDSASTIERFEASCYDAYYSMIFEVGLQAASAMQPNGGWQTPDEFETSERLPIDAIKLLFRLDFQDANSATAAWIATKERAAYCATSQGDYHGQGYNLGVFTAILDLQDSQDVRIGGVGNDDPNLNLYIKGFTGRR